MTLSVNEVMLIEVRLLKTRQIPLTFEDVTDPFDRGCRRLGGKPRDRFPG